MRDSQVGVTGGRKLAYTDAGEPGWPCVLFFHGAPSSRLRLAYLEPLFLEKHVSRGFMAASGFTFPEPDEKLYNDERIARLLAVARAEAFRQGVAGYAQDILIQGRPWPFDPGAIAAPIHVLHGEADTLLPLAHARHTAELIPGSALRILPEHGHFTILAELPLMASTLASR